MDEQQKLAKAQHDLRRWLTKLKRAATMVDKLQAKCTRLDRKIARTEFSEIDRTRLGSPGRSELEKETAALVDQAPPLPLPSTTEVKPPATVTLPPDNLDIPKGLLRGKLADEAAKAEIQAAIEARKAVKAKASAARSKAKAKGDLRRMPLQGKAALAFLAQTTQK